MYNFIVILFCIVVPLIIQRKVIVQAIKEKQSVKQFILNNKYDIAIYFIFVIGFLVRMLSLISYPAGLNQDEASAGYEAYSVLNYGIDRKGKSFPVHFISWGSGQNVLYSYLMFPFIYLFGLNELTVRLPMAIIGCITLIFVYKLLKQHDKTLGIIGLAFFAICPWHIMKSRWGLESNLFPDMVIIAICIIINSINKEKMSKFYIGIAILALSVYSYGTSYLVLPIFIVLMLIYLWKAKKIKLQNAMIALSIAFIIALPLIAFVYINKFNYQEIKLGFVTIPRMYVNRYESDISIFSGNLFKNALENLTNNMKIILTQNDGTAYNCLPFFGIIYVFSLPFTVMGIFKCAVKKNTEKNILNILGITCLILMIVYNNTNINRLNIVMVPLIIYTIIGLYDVIKNNKNSIIPIVVLYCISFMCFTDTYINYQGKEKSPFTQGVEEPIKYADSLNTKKVYISYTFIEPYIYTLFYTKTPPNEFQKDVEYYQANVAFESIKSFGKYYFYIPANMEEEDVAYIVPVGYNYDKTKLKATNFERYIVLENKE